MQEGGMITVFLGIMAVCMVIMTIIVVIVGLKVHKTMNQLQTFVKHTEKELTLFFAKAVLSFHELHQLTRYLHTQTKALTLKASNGIAKVTLASLLVSVVSAILKKSHPSKDKS